MAPSSTSSSHDVPFAVRDRRRKGFFTIDNELLDRFGDQLKAHGLAVYMALARFADQDSTCWPSLATIARITGVSRPQVIREIAKLKALNLIAVEHQVNEKGEYSSNIYTLLDISSPPPDAGVVSDRDQGGISQTPPLVSAGDQGGISQRPKQHLVNKTQHRNKTHRTTRARDNNNNSGDSPAPSTVVVVVPPPTSLPTTVATELHHHPENATPAPEAPIPLDPPSPTTDGQAAEQALLALGIGQAVAQRLATRYRAERIAEKIEFLAFLQAERPDAITNPRGWLRRAIEEDYGPPDGYLTAAERAQQAEEEAEQEEARLRLEQQQQAFADRQAAFRQGLAEQYGTTEADEQFWREVLLDFKYGPKDIYDLFLSAYILSVNDERVQLGFTHEMLIQRVLHRGTLAALKRSLKMTAKRPLEVEPVLLSEAEVGWPGRG